MKNKENSREMPSDSVRIAPAAIQKSIPREFIPQSRIQLNP
jgi:hypothetical protein